MMVPFQRNTVGTGSYALTQEKQKLVISISTTELKNEKFDVKFCNKEVKFNPNPTYLGYKMDRTVTHKANVEKVAQKIKSRNNILQKLGGTDWGLNANTMCTVALGLVYSTAEYCSPVWLRSSHFNKVDTQLNNTLRIVSGALRSTPLPWLPVLANIAPSKIRREAALTRE